MFYGNEKEVGAGIRAKIADGVVKREDIFVTSKVPPIVSLLLLLDLNDVKFYFGNIAVFWNVTPCSLVDRY
jgi:hypothetical protein